METSHTGAVATSSAAAPVSRPLAASSVIIAPLPSYEQRWKTGPYAQTNLKVGENAQTDFAPFAPSEHAGWNKTSGYTITAGGSNVRIR